MGKDGQSMFMVAYAGKKTVGKVFLDLLGIEFEWINFIQNRIKKDNYTHKNIQIIYKMNLKGDYWFRYKF